MWLTDSEKLFGDIKYSFQIKNTHTHNLSKLDMEENFLNLLKGISENLWLALYLMMKIWPCPSGRSGTKEGCPFVLPVSFMD